MNYRIASMLAAESIATAATKTIDITLGRPISRITVQVKGTNNGNTPTAHPAKIVSKIEVVDGSNVLYSLTGIQAQALDYYESGRLPTNLMQYQDDLQCGACFELNFGRHLWDEALALDPRKFQNPQLKITHNKASGGSAPDAGELSVFAHVFDEKAATPAGFLMSKEQYGYTLVASAKETIDMALDMPYRLIMLQSLTAAKQPWQQYNKIKLSEDNDQRVVINDELTSDLIKLLADYPRIHEEILCKDLDAAPTVYCTPGYLISVSALGLDSADTALFTTQAYGGAITITGTADKRAQLNVTGVAPHNAMGLFMGKKEIIEDWYDVSKVGSLRLIITAGSAASGTCEIVTQQYRKYSA